MKAHLGIDINAIYRLKELTLAKVLCLYPFRVVPTREGKIKLFSAKYFYDY